MTHNVALIATSCTPDVAFIAPHGRCDFRYTPKMLKMHEWVQEAHKASGLSASELSRRLYEKIGRESADRSLIGKMSKAPGSTGAKARRTSIEEAIALSEIVAYPLPESLRKQLQSDNPKPPSASTDRLQLVNQVERDLKAPLEANDIDEPIVGERAIRSVLGRIVGLTPKDVPQVLSVVMRKIGLNTAPEKSSLRHDQARSANHHREELP